MIDDELCFPKSTVNVSRLRRRSSGGHSVSSFCSISSRSSSPSLLTVKQQLNQQSKMEAKHPQMAKNGIFNGKIYEYKVGDSMYTSEPSLIRPIALKPVIIPGRKTSLSEILGTELFSNGSIPSNQDIEKAIEIIRTFRYRSVSEVALQKPDSGRHRRHSDVSEVQRGKRMIRQHSAPARRKYNSTSSTIGSVNSAFQSISTLQPLPETDSDNKCTSSSESSFVNLYIPGSPEPQNTSKLSSPCAVVEDVSTPVSSTTVSSTESPTLCSNPRNRLHVASENSALQPLKLLPYPRKDFSNSPTPVAVPKTKATMTPKQKSALERNRRNRIRSQKCSQPSISENEVDESVDRMINLRYSPNTHPRALLPAQIANCSGNHPPVSYLNSLKRSKSVQVKHVPSNGLQKVPNPPHKDTGEFRVFNPTRIRPISPPRPSRIVNVETECSLISNGQHAIAGNDVYDIDHDLTDMSHIEDNVFGDPEESFIPPELQCYSNDIDNMIKKRNSHNFEEDIQSFLVKSESFSSNKLGKEVNKITSDKLADIRHTFNADTAIPEHDSASKSVHENGNPVQAPSKEPKHSRDSGYSESTSNSVDGELNQRPVRTRSASMSIISKLKPLLKFSKKRQHKVVELDEDNPFHSILKDDPITHFTKSLDDLIHRRLSLQNTISNTKFTPLSSQSSVFEEASLKFEVSEEFSRPRSEACPNDNNNGTLRAESGLSSMATDDDEFVISPLNSDIRSCSCTYMRKSVVNFHCTSEPYTVKPLCRQDPTFSLQDIQEILNCFEVDKDTPQEYSESGAIKDVLESQVTIALSSIYQTLINSKIPDNEIDNFALPVLENTLDYLDEVLDVEDDNEDVMELVGLIESLEDLMSLHDEVISRKYYENETLPEINPTKKFTVMDDGEERPAKQSIYRMVGLHKNRGEPLGITLKKDDDKVVVHRILAGGMIDRQKLLHIGDEIVSINGQNVEPKPDVIQSRLRSIEGDIQLKIVPSYKEQSPHCQVFVKALFNYDPSTDDLIPCKEAGLRFKEGDILQIVNQDDANWWQAKVEGGEGQAGLIPGLILLEQRMAGQGGTPDNGTYVGCGPISRKKKKKKLNYSANKNSEFDQHEINLYEEVAKMPPFNRKTLVLIGAQGVGRRSLISKLVLNEPDKFGNTMPHTSRPMRPGEKDGGGYWFTSREKMNEDIANHKYLEYGEYENHLYGTKLDSIRQVMRSGKMCLLDVNPQSLKILKTPEFVPYVVFIEAPSFQTLLKMHRESAQDNPHRAFSENDLKRSIEESKRLKRQYSHYFDIIIQNDDMDRTYVKLYECISKLSTSPQWVPVSWVY